MALALAAAYEARVHYLYCLEFPNGKKYIGLSCRPEKRLADHQRNARYLRHGSNTPVYNAIKKYGRPTLNILCSGTLEYIADLEIKAIAAFRTRNKKLGYNVLLGGDLAPRRTPEVAAKIYAARIGKSQSPEWRANISAALKGRRRPNISAALKGRVSPMKGRSSPLKGKRLSADTRAKMSAVRKGRPSPLKGKILPASSGNRRKHTPEHRANISAAMTPEVRAKISAKLKDRVLSPETRAKISAAITPEMRAKISAAMTQRRRRQREEKSMTGVVLGDILGDTYRGELL